MPELRAKFTADDSDIRAKADRLSGMVGSLGRRIGGAFAVWQVARFADHVASVADNVEDVSDSVGVSPRFLQSFQALAREAGVSVEKVELALNRISAARVEALADPLGSAAKQFAKMGLSAQALEGMDVAATVEAVGKAAAEGANEFEKMAAVTDLIGVRSKRLVGVLQSLGREGFQGVATAAEQSRQIMDDDVIAAGRAFSKTKDLVLKQAEVLTARMMVPMHKAWRFMFGAGVSAADQAATDQRTEEQMNIDRGRFAKAARAGDLGAAAEFAGAYYAGPAGAKLSEQKESIVARKLREAAEAVQMKTALGFGNVSDQMIRIGGARGVDSGVQQINILRSMDASLKKIAGQPTGLGW
jgi:hypothetical protein